MASFLLSFNSIWDIILRHGQMLKESEINEGIPRGLCVSEGFRKGLVCSMRGVYCLRSYKLKWKNYSWEMIFCWENFDREVNVYDLLEFPMPNSFCEWLTFRFFWFSFSAHLPTNGNWHFVLGKYFSFFVFYFIFLLKIKLRFEMVESNNGSNLRKLKCFQWIVLLLLIRLGWISFSTITVKPSSMYVLVELE